MSEDVSYYLVERLGEAVGAGVIPSAIVVLISLVLITRDTKATIVAGMIGSQFVPLVSLLTLASATMPPIMTGGPADIAVSVILLAAVGAGVGLVGNLVVWCVRGLAA